MRNYVPARRLSVCVPALRDKIPKEAVPIDPKQERHISMQSAKSPETAATSARKKNGKKKKNKPRYSIFGTIMRFIGCLLCVCVMAASAGAVLLSL